MEYFVSKVSAKEDGRGGKIEQVCRSLHLPLRPSSQDHHRRLHSCPLVLLGPISTEQTHYNRWQNLHRVVGYV
jgi:hypothetical protein